MLYILLGQDDFSRHQWLDEMKKGMGDPALLEANTATFDGQQVTLDQLRAVGETVPFLGERRLVIVDGLLGRFEARTKSSRQKKVTPASNHQNDYKALAAGISQLPDSIVLVLIDDKVKSSNPLLRELSARAEVKSFPLLNDTELRQWIKKRVTKEGGSISAPAVELLAKLVGSNLWALANEISKLVLFASGRRIEEEDINRVVSYAQEANVFTMVDAILDFKAGVAQQLLQQLLQEGAAPAYLLVMLSRQVRMIVQVKELVKQGKTKVEIQDKLGLTKELAWRKTSEQAGKYPWARLKQVYHRLLEADLSIKTGKYGGELALNLLIAELGQ